MRSTEPSTNNIKLNVNQYLNQPKDEVSQEQIKLSMKAKSPKPPKPILKKGDESMNSLSNSVNLSQLIRDTKPQENSQPKKKLAVESKPKSEQRKLDSIEEKKPLKIDVKNIKFKKNGKIAVIKLNKPAQQ